jgi:hypothetical protein
MGEVTVHSKVPPPVPVKSKGSWIPSGWELPESPSRLIPFVLGTPALLLLAIELEVLFLLVLPRGSFCQGTFENSSAIAGSGG